MIPMALSVAPLSLSVEILIFDLVIPVFALHDMMQLISMVLDRLYFSYQFDLYVFIQKVFLLAFMQKFGKQS